MIKFIIFAVVCVLFSVFAGFEQFTITALVLIIYRLFTLEEKVVAMLNE